MQERPDKMTQTQAKVDSTVERREEIAAVARVSRRGGVISLIGGSVMVGALAAGAYMFTTDTQIAAFEGGRLQVVELGLRKASHQLSTEEIAALADKYGKHLRAVKKLGDAGTGVIQKWTRLVKPEEPIVASEVPTEYNFGIEKGEDLAATLSRIIDNRRLGELDDFNKSLANLRMTVDIAESTYPWSEESYPTATIYNPDWSPDPDNHEYAKFLQSQMAWCKALYASETHGIAAD